MSARVKYDNKVTIVLKGDLTVKNAAKMKSNIVKALKNCETVAISFGGIRKVDLSCLQLLCSAHRSAVRREKMMYFESDIPPHLNDLAMISGFLRLEGCQLECGKGCFWKSEAGARYG
jgi:ABC-type transporter Mla MlaB component